MGNRVYSRGTRRKKEGGKDEAAKNGENLKDARGEGWMSEGSMSER